MLSQKFLLNDLSNVILDFAVILLMILFFHRFHEVTIRSGLTEIPRRRYRKE